MEAAAYVATTPGEKDPVARLTLARHDPDAGLLGFAHARTAAIGSVPVAGVSNITESSPLGAGLHVSNYPLTRPERFDTQSISGPLPPGWDVELYHNDVLVGWRQADPSGIYDFAELALQFGRNDFKLVFRGPQGQFREETQHFQVGDTLTPSGAFYYRIAAHPWESAGVTALTQFDWGLSRQLSVAGGLTWLSDAAQPYASAGVRGIVAGMFISADAARSPAGDWLGNVGLRARFGALGVTLSHTQVNDFTSDVFRAGTGVRTRSEVRLDGALRLLGRRFPADLTLRRDHRAGGDTQQLSTRIGAQFGGVALSNQFNWGMSEPGNDINGTLLLTRRFDRIGMRAQVTYDAHVHGLLDSVAVTLEQRAANGWLWSADLDHSVTRHETLLSVGANRAFEAFALGARGGWSSSDEAFFALNLFMSVGREPRSGAWHVDAAPTAGSGAVSARAFLDSNLNGVRDAAEPLLPGVAFQINGGRQQARTGDDGVAVLGRLPTSQVARVGIEPGSLEDPYWLPRPAGVRVVPRPGKVLVVDFPVIPTTEIDGTLYVVDATRRRQPLAGRRVALRGADGAVVATTESTGDGFYVMANVPPANGSSRWKQWLAKRRRRAAL